MSDALLEQLRERLGEPLTGWDAINSDAADELAEREFAEQLDHATLYRQAFTTPAGVYVLEDLIRMFARQRIVRPSDDQFTVGIRQGQADVVHRILFLIEFANRGGRVPPEQGKE